MRDLRPLFDPRSVAVLGASNDPSKWGQWIAAGALRGAHRRDVWLVNRKGGEILGRQALRSLDELPEAPELVVVALAAAAFEDAIDASLAAGARAIVAITAGLGEVGAEGKARELAVVERVRAAGAVMLGPNCLGVYDASAELDLGSNEFSPGSMGIISQSGNLALELSLLAAQYGVGVSRFASLGNQADIEAAELVEAFAADEATRVIGVYCEDFRDGRAFARAGAAALAAGKQVVLLAAGGSEAGARAAASHTGALASDSAAVDAACRAAGIQRVTTPKELVDVALACLAPHRPRGRRLAVVGDGGGTGVVSADLATAAGLELPHLSEELSAKLTAIAPTIVATNPVDLAGAGEQDFWNFERVTEAVLASGEVDAVVLTGYFGGYSQMNEDFRERETEVARAIAAAAGRAGRPLLVQAMFWDSGPARALREGGVPVYRDIEAVIATLAALVEQELRPAAGVAEVGAAAPPVCGGGYFEARELLAAGGVPFTPARRATTAAGAREAAAAVGYPVALKALGLLHKSDAGGVALGLGDEHALEDALSDMAARLAPEGYSVEAMADTSAGVELIAGCRRDPRFGPLVLVGLGGVYAELMNDVAVALAPAGVDELEQLLLSLRGAGVLTGARGRAPLDVRAAAAAAAALSRVAAAHPEIAEIEVNPLLVTPAGSVGLDARIVLA
ncbi:Acyl-CoA synthetase (NDP forming) [Gaiella occulta]|uniref:Acyl-CoA synthetase (NDP forming) n=1 Tax=Gaiella occulta TaxID=1002870 RepID=A0A7M2Z0B7_9ACTN|nr:acetate--CoA ligase family protein [Gaiella occulta]RDI75858.1 Acyl-CoA synthetase (NDP forming) [Gaiella occulta]